MHTPATEPIKAVTFDFWRTLFRDTRARERHRARVSALSEIAGIEHARAKEAMKHTMQEFLRVHIAEQRTLRPVEAVPILEAHLAETIEPEHHSPLAEAFGLAVLEHPPEPIPDAIEAVAETARRVPIGLISDTGISPPESLEVLLREHGLADHFTVLTFSGRMDVAKPQAPMFERTAEALGCQVSETLHIGDLEPTDIAGALALGARAALFAGDNDRFAENTAAHHTLMSWSDYLVRLDEIIGDDSLGSARDSSS